MDASSGIAPLLMMSANTAAKPTFLAIIFHRQCRLPFYYCDFLCVVGSVAFSRCHFPCVFLLFSLFISLSPSLFLLSSMGGLLASTSEVMKAPAYILMHSLPGEPVLYSWQP